MTSYRVFPHPVDSKREEFRKYLEKTGVLDALTRALVELMEETEKPNDAVGFLQKQLSTSSSHASEAASLQEELSKVKEELKLLQTENNNLKTKLQQYEGNGAKKETANNNTVN